MSLTYKFDKGDKNNPEKKDENISTENKNDLELYDTPANVRNICFIQANGKHLFLNYAYLISGEFSQEEDLITLIFTTNTIIIEGRNLEKLFELLLNYKPRCIRSRNKRYLETSNKEELFVTGITIKTEQK